MLVVGRYDKHVSLGCGSLRCEMVTITSLIEFDNINL